jgi:hypothetical protein
VSAGTVSASTVSAGTVSAGTVSAVQGSALETHRLMLFGCCGVWNWLWGVRDFNNNNIYLLQMGCHPVSVTTLIYFTTLLYFNR